MTLPRFFSVVILLAVCWNVSAVLAEENLSNRIDQLVESRQIGPVAPPCSDADFLRRVTLDLHGVVPTSTEARSFIDDQTPDKRTALIDRLLSSPRYAVHLANVFDVMLMERHADKNQTNADWQKYLQAAFEKNVPYDQLAREILRGAPEDEKSGYKDKFFVDRDAEPHLMTRDIGRLFFGMDLQCAQCHDHPLIEHYQQTDYYGLFAFVNRVVTIKDANLKIVAIGEKSDGDASYKSVFTQDAGHIRPQLPGENEISEPRFRQGEDYVVAPLPTVRPIPQYSRRAKLAELATSGTNKQFNANIANRLWAHMMGRGLVHPVDLHHPLNPATNPAVLDLLSTEFVAMKFDIRAMLRALALTRTYQRSIELPTTDIAPLLATASSRVTEEATKLDALMSAANQTRQLVETAMAAFKTARTALGPAETAWQTAETAVSTAKKPLDASQTAIAKSQSDESTKQSAANAINEAVTKSTEAAKLLPKDKDIASATATLTSKQKQLADELAAIKKSIAEQQAAQVTLRKAVTDSYPPADQAFADYLEARKPVDQSKASLIEVWNRYQLDCLAVAIQRKRLDDDRAYASLQTQIQNRDAARTSIERLQAELAAGIIAVKQQDEAVSLLNQATKEREADVSQSARLFTEIKQQFDQKQTVVQTVKEAAAKTELALQLLPGDADLAQLLQKLFERLEPLKKELTAFEQIVTTREGELKLATSKLAEAKLALDAATNEKMNRQNAVTAKTNSINQTSEAAEQADAAIKAGQSQLSELWTISLGVRTVKQLTPEQLAWSTMQATGLLEPQRATADAEVEKTLAKATVSADPAQSRGREMAVEVKLLDQVKGNVAPFVTHYGALAGQSQDDFFATPDQALFVANGGTLIGWASGGHLSTRLAAITDPAAFADELYLSTLTRRPTATEVNEVSQFLASRTADRPQAIRDLIWSLLASAEFRFNH